MAISKFKATCLAVLERVRRTGEPVRVTRFGKPVADIVPPAPPSAGESWLGGLRGRARIAGDLIEPAVAASEWEAIAGEASPVPKRPRARGGVRKRRGR